MKKRVYARSTKPSSKAVVQKKARTSNVIRLGRPTAIARSRYHKTKLTYAQYFSLDPALSTAAVQVFTANGLYDPDITGTGHQPAGFDQYMALYGEYIVTGSWIKVTAFNSDTNVGQVLGVTFCDKSTTSADTRVYIEGGNSKYFGMGTTAADGVKSITHYANIRSVSTQDIFNEDNFAGTASANPTDTHYWHIWGYAIDDGSNTSPIRCLAEIQYEVYFRDPALTALS